MGLPSITGGSVATSFGTANSATNVASNSFSNEFPGVDAFTPKASDIFEKRTVTRIFDSHQGIALQSIEGGQFPRFDENQNLYGFTIFQFKRGVFGGGWAPINIASLLGSDLGSVASGMLGGDQVANVSSYFFNVHPSAINLSEPFATHLVPTQGGGVYAESQGSILRQITIAGTTGYRPALVHTPTPANDKTIPHTVNEPTGYLNFLKLRNLFRNYSDLKKRKSLAYKTYMIWYNNKEQEAWFFEPSEFTTNRDSSSPFTYEYNISGTLIQKVNFSTIVNKLAPDPTSVHFWVASMRRSARLLNGFFGLIPGVGDDAVGEALEGAGQFLGKLDDLDNFVMSVVETGFGVIGTGALLAGTISTLGWQVRNQLNSAFGFEGDVQGRYENIFGPSADYDTAFNQTLKTMLSIDHLISEATKAATKLLSPEGVAELRAVSAGSGRAAQGGRGTLNGGQEYLDNSNNNMVPVAVPQNVEDAQTWVESQTNEPSAWAITVLYNDLQYPYISQTPTYQTGFSKFLLPGDVIYIPMGLEYVEGDINTLINPAKAAMATYEEILGRDIRLIKSTHSTTGVSEFNLSISSTGDLDIIVGKENIKQAIEIKLNTERGELTPHPQFGIVPVIGNKGTLNLNFNLYLSLNDTMLSDGRITELTDTYVRTSGDKILVQTKAHVIGHVPYIPLLINMG